MSLGPDRSVCLAELKAALKAVAGDAVDKPPADANLAALAEAIYKILAADAAVSVRQADNTAFWSWLTTVGTNSGAGPPPASFGGRLT